MSGCPRPIMPRKRAKHYSDKTFELRVTETVTKLVTVDAHDEDAARAKYNKGDYDSELEVDLVDWDIQSVKEVE